MTKSKENTSNDFEVDKIRKDISEDKDFVVTYPLWTCYPGRLPIDDSLKTEILTVGHLSQYPRRLVQKCIRLGTSM